MVDVIYQIPDAIGNGLGHGRQVAQRWTTIGLRALNTEAQRFRILNREQERQVK